MTPGIVLDEEMRAVLSHLAEGDDDDLFPLWPSPGDEALRALRVGGLIERVEPQYWACVVWRITAAGRAALKGRG